MRKILYKIVLVQWLDMNVVFCWLGIVIDATFDHHLTHFWRKQMKFVEQLGTAVIRDPDPQNDLQFLRIQTRKFEILLAIGMYGMRTLIF